uniref:Uncharacterized protein n=1 Tax=Ignisphaera aggregans TaxID=334771 RepID=A0A7C2VLX5_9CREN
MAIEKLVLVTASHLPQHKHFKKLGEDLSKELGVELEIREEDYEFVSMYGEKDDFGMAWLPQLFAVVNGNIVPVLTKFPINEKTLDYDYEKAKQEVKARLKL